MAGASFEMDLSGLDMALKGALRKIQETQDVMEQAGEILVNSTKLRFKDQADPEGKAWDSSQRAEAVGGQTMVESGQLRSSIVAQVSSKTLLVGTNKEYGAIHQFGGEAGRGKKVKIPARPYLGFTEEDRQEIQDALADFMRSSMGV
ncbi:MAG: phage virion morphogenesis protein [Desulfovibrio sp.]